MRRFDVIIFDLDGTLADTGPGIIETLKHTSYPLLSFRVPPSPLR